MTYASRVAAITKPKVIAVEGRDEENFFNALLTFVRLTDIQVIPMEGKCSLTDKIEAVTKIQGFGSATSFGVVIDADDSYTDAFRSVCGALEDLNLPVPTQPLRATGLNPKVIVMIMPRKNKNGMLEDLCLEGVESDAATLCVRRYIMCLSNRGITTNNDSKARIHAFLSSRREPDLRLGEAALEGYWPFENKAFDEVKRFIRTL